MTDSPAPPSDEPLLPAPTKATPTRKTKRQSTSVASHRGEEVAEDDPLLAFAPYLHTHPRRNSITPDVQRRFVAHLAATGVVTHAARHVGRSLEALYALRHRKGAEAFSAAWETAQRRADQRLEDVAKERSLVGTRTPIVSGGEILGWWDKPDHALLRFLLSHRRPEIYGQRTGNLEPGNPLYDRIAEDVMARYRATIPTPTQIRASIEAKVQAIRVEMSRPAWDERRRLEASEDLRAEMDAMALDADGGIACAPAGALD